MAHLTGYDVFRIYNGLKSHFDIGRKYDYTSQGGYGYKKQYEKGRGKYFFDKIARAYHDADVERLFIANLIINPNIWIKDIASDEGHQIYLRWCKINFSLKENFKNDLTSILKVCKNKGIEYNDVFVAPDRDFPIIINMINDGTISLETFCILNKMMQITPFLNRDLAGDPLWEVLRDKVWLYQDLINFNLDEMYQIAKQKFKGK